MSTVIECPDCGHWLSEPDDDGDELVIRERCQRCIDRYGEDPEPDEYDRG